MEGFHTNDPRITHLRHSTILEMLRAHCDEANEDRNVVDLVTKLLVWEPGQRWSADQALEHVCWDPIMQGRDESTKNVEATEAGPSQVKKNKANNVNSSPDSKCTLSKEALARNSVSHG